jgi:hypothetical protein
VRPGSRGADVVGDGARPPNSCYPRRAGGSSPRCGYSETRCRLP